MNGKDSITYLLIAALCGCIAYLYVTKESLATGRADGAEVSRKSAEVQQHIAEERGNQEQAAMYAKRAKAEDQRFEELRRKADKRGVESDKGLNKLQEKFNADLKKATGGQVDLDAAAAKLN